MVVGAGSLRFELIADWPRIPAGMSQPDVAAVAVNSGGEAHLFCRSENPVQVFDADDGSFIRSWGEDVFAYKSAHGLHIDAADNVLLVDIVRHTLGRYTPHGKPLLEVGTPGIASETGHTGGTGGVGVMQAAGPFNRPTDVCVDGQGNMFATDGYGNARVHRFDSAGALVASWGQPGSGQGCLAVPHGIAMGLDGNLIIADRENDRLQVMTPDGDFVGTWTDVQRPCQVFLDRDGLVYVAEMGRRAGDVTPYGRVVREDLPSRISIFSPDGELILRWGGPDGSQDGHFVAAHDLWVGSDGALYVAEVSYTMGVAKGLVPPGTRAIQKFGRL
jgi:DNA-binding beta-propeller fold protein YncE